MSTEYFKKTSFSHIMKITEGQALQIEFIGIVDI